MSRHPEHVSLSLDYLHRVNSALGNIINNLWELECVTLDLKKADCLIIQMNYLKQIKEGIMKVLNNPGKFQVTV